MPGLQGLIDIKAWRNSLPPIRPPAQGAPALDKATWLLQWGCAGLAAGVFGIVIAEANARIARSLLDSDWVSEVETVGPGFSLVGQLVRDVRKGRVCRKYMNDQYPNMIRFTNGLFASIFPDVVLIKCPVMSRAVLEEPDTRRPEVAYRCFRRLHGYYGGPDFLSFRSHKEPIYTRTRRLLYRGIMERTYRQYNQEYLATVDKLVSPESVAAIKGDIVHLMHKVATGVLARMAFGTDDDAFDMKLFNSCIWMIMDVIERPQNVAAPMLDWLPTPRNFSLWKYQRNLRDAILGLIEAKRKLPGGSLRQNDDLVSLLLVELSDLTQDQQDRAIVGLLGVLFFAGFDTTAGTMSLVMHRLAEHPQIQEDVRAEVFELCGRDPTAPLQIEQLFRCNRLLAVIKETLRLDPTVPMLAREVTMEHPTGISSRSMALPSWVSKFTGLNYLSRSGFVTSINVYALHYNKKGWSKPDQFVPERWTDASIDAGMDPSQRVYCPFALGKRGCFGRQFAYVEMLTVLARMMQRYVIMPRANHPPIVVEGGTLTVRGLRLTFDPLESHMKSMKVGRRTKTYTPDEVAKHNKRDDCWLIIDGSVYDVTPFISPDLTESQQHPGGVAVLLNLAGTDASADYHFVQHSPVASKLLEEYYIGEVGESPRARADSGDKLRGRADSGLSQGSDRSGGTPRARSPAKAPQSPLRVASAPSLMHRVDSREWANTRSALGDDELADEFAVMKKSRTTTKSQLVAEVTGSASYLTPGARLRSKNLEASPASGMGLGRFD